MIRYAELHKFADERFVSSGYTHFVWTVCEDSFAPSLPPEYGMAVVVEGADPTTLQRYNPTTGLYASRLADDFVPELRPFYEAVWRNDTKTWTIDPAN